MIASYSVLFHSDDDDKKIDDDVKKKENYTIYLFSIQKKVNTIKRRGLTVLILF